MTFKIIITSIFFLIASTTSYSKDIEQLQKLAKSGNTKSQLSLGELYEKGEGLTQDYTLAAIWYRKAAESGNDEAQHRLGRMYDKGSGVPQDYEKAQEWFEKAATQGNSQAQFDNAYYYYHYDKKSFLNWFGNYYRDGQYKKAAFWFEKAAKQGHIRALVFLGGMYEEGEGVERNIEKSQKYYRKAAELGDSYAQWCIGKMHQEGEGNAGWDYEKAVFWFKKAALNGYDSAAEELGDIYNEGLEKPDWGYDGKKGITKNNKEAVKWYLLAVKNGNSYVFEKLGRAYFEGNGVPKDYIEAAKWFHKDAVKTGYESQYYLSKLYSDGQGVIQNKYKCYIWASLAVKGVENGLVSITPYWKKRLVEFKKLQQGCELKITKIEKQTGNEIVNDYWDKSWNTSGGFVIPIEL